MAASAQLNYPMMMQMPTEAAAAYHSDPVESYGMYPSPAAMGPNMGPYNEQQAFPGAMSEDEFAKAYNAGPRIPMRRASTAASRAAPQPHPQNTYQPNTRRRYGQ